MIEFDLLVMEERISTNHCELLWNVGIPDTYNEFIFSLAINEYQPNRKKNVIVDALVFSKW